MKKVILFSLLMASASAMADQSQINAIENAAMQLDKSSLVSLTDQVETYDKALALYRLSITQNLMAESTAAIESLNSAIDELEAYTKKHPEDGEAWALLSQSYGLQIGYQPMKGAYYGPKAGLALGKAFNYAPQSPRTHLVKAVSEYNTPAAFGGSKKAALKTLDTALSLFQADNGQNQWGHAEAFIWRGLAKQSLNQNDAAIQDWQQALDIAPNYRWASMLISKNQ